MTTTFFGQGVAVAGMKTSCGATLIATQFTDTVEWGGGGASTGAAGSAAAAAKSVTSVKAKDTEAVILASASANYDLFFHVKHDATGNNLSNTPYKITLDDGREFKGVTDKNGYTQKVFSDSPQTAKIEVPYYDNSAAQSTIESDPCGCQCSERAERTAMGASLPGQSRHERAHARIPDCCGFIHRGNGGGWSRSASCLDVSTARALLFDALGVPLGTVRIAN